MNRPSADGSGGTGGSERAGGRVVMNYPSKVMLTEVGLRDGLQNECTSVSTDRKMELLTDILAAGFKAVEIGSFVRPDRVPQMADSGELFRRALALGRDDVDFRALVPNYRGLENALASGCRSVKIGVSASTAHNMRNYNRTPEESIAAFEKIFARAADEGIRVIGTVQMAFGSPWDGEIPPAKIMSIVEIYKKYGIRKVGLGDTASMANPKSTYALCSALLEKYPEIHFKLHLHTARGLGLSNVLAAMEAGITEFDSSFAGLGGCPFVPEAAGNIATEDLLNMMDELGVETGVDMDNVMEIGRQAEQLVGHAGRSAVLRAGTNRDLVRRVGAKEKR